MDWKIVTDSSCDFYELEKKDDKVGFATVPFVISIDGVDYVDDESLQVDDVIDAIDNCKETSFTSCPSPAEWINAIGDAKKCFLVTISSSLSGSFNSAGVAKKMILEEDPSRQIEILDSLSTGPTLCLIVRKLQQLIADNDDFDVVKDEIHKYMKTMHVVFALCSYNNLVRNGRMSKIAGLVASKLRLIGVGIASPEGTIEVKKIARGSKKVIEVILDDIKERGENCRSIIISHCQNEELALMVKEAIDKLFESIDIKIIPTRGLDSYYAEKHGIIVGY
ncbi:MAG: DegV family EDD domain-containing protein [Eubacterium sp.]|nr:DegV family EDD domain-containing protein [Eubacterium sp.]